jgi:hypothetical protein
VLHLCDRLSQCVGGDDFQSYTSSEQAAELFKKNHRTRTVNKSRKGLPAQFKRLTMKKGEMQTFHKNGVMIALAWKEKSYPAVEHLPQHGHTKRRKGSQKRGK